MSSRFNVQKSDHLPELVLVLGQTGVGKSTFIKAATGLDVGVGHHLESYTAEVQIYPVAGSHMFLIDTPGFDDQARSDTDILETIASCLGDLYEGLSFTNQRITLSGAIYIHSINEARMTRSMKRNLSVFGALIGEENMQSCVLATSKWSLPSPEEAQQRESDLIERPDFWGQFLAAGAAITRYEDSKKSALELIEMSKQAGAFIPRLTQEYVINKVKLHRTSAGRALDEDITAARDRYEKDLQKWQDEHDEALRINDARAAADFEVYSQETEAKIKALEKELRQLRESTTREQTQKAMDDLESDSESENESLKSSHKGTRKSSAEKENGHHKRRNRALRWFARSIAIGGAVAMSVASHGALIPVGLTLYGGVETVLQKMKDREEMRKAGKASLMDD